MRVEPTIPDESEHGPDDATRRAARRNIEAIAKLEENFDRNRSFGDRIADAIGTFAGTVSFVVIHCVAFAAWIFLNTGAIPDFPKFDPYPFTLLILLVSLEAIFLSTFVLMKQNRMSQRADQRAKLDLQINLLAEQEMTHVLQMLRDLSDRLGAPAPSVEVADLSEATSVEAVADELQRTIEPTS
jgi:uncharacterized membrane protein